MKSPSFVSVHTHGVVWCGTQGPKYFTKDTLTNRDERFFAAEIVRESVFHTYKVPSPTQSPSLPMPPCGSVLMPHVLIRHFFLLVGLCVLGWCGVGWL